MAIDTENKRRSAIRSVHAVADGAISGFDRRHAIRIYAGISTVAGVGPFKMVAGTVFTGGPIAGTVFEPGSVSAKGHSGETVAGKGVPC